MTFNPESFNLHQFLISIQLFDNLFLELQVPIRQKQPSFSKVSFFIISSLSFFSSYLILYRFNGQVYDTLFGVVCACVLIRAVKI